MIDVLAEQTISFAKAGKMFNPEVARTTVRRWGTVGVHGHRLETMWRGGRKCTTVDAVRRFMREINENGNGKK